MNTLAISCYGLGEAVRLTQAASSHAKGCNESSRDALKEQLGWITQWPRYCQTCNGRGGFTDPGTYWIPPDWSICSDCQEDVRCPRCGTAGETYDQDADDSVACKICGWTWTDADALPYLWECDGDCVPCDNCGEPQEDCACCQYCGTAYCAEEYNHGKPV